MQKVIKILLIILAVLAALLMAALVFLQFWKPLGALSFKDSENVYAQRQANYSDGKFSSPEHYELLTEVEGEPDPESDEKTPKGEIPVNKFTELPEAPSDSWQVTWLGHSSFILQLDGKVIVVDPVLSDYASPVQGIGPKRMADTPVSIDNMPETDILVISHDHYDHLDYNTITALDGRVKEYVVPLGVEQHLIRWGVDPEKIHTFAWWEEHEVAGIKISATPSQHNSNRLPWLSNSTLWCGYVFEADGKQIYYSGDTGNGEFFKEINARYGKMDLAIIENGQYNKRWKYTHMTPEQSEQAAVTLEAEVVMPVHWAGFAMSTHSWREPIERFTKAAADDELTVITPVIGTSVNENNIADNQTHWWESVK